MKLILVIIFSWQLQLGYFNITSADPAPSPSSISLFGDKPIQLSVDKTGIHQKRGGFICSLKSSMSNKPYSEWGETEKDARIIVHKKCSNDSGLILCKEGNVTCQKEE